MTDTEPWTDDRQVGLLREALRAALLSYRGPFDLSLPVHRASADIFTAEVDAVANHLALAVAQVPAQEPICTCGPWKIGQPQGHLPGCPRAALLSALPAQEERQQ